MNPGPSRVSCGTVSQAQKTKVPAGSDGIGKGHGEKVWLRSAGLCFYESSLLRCGLGSSLVGIGSKLCFQGRGPTDRGLPDSMIMWLAECNPHKCPSSITLCMIEVRTSAPGQAQLLTSTFLRLCYRQMWGSRLPIVKGKARVSRSSKLICVDRNIEFRSKVTAELYLYCLPLQLKDETM